MKKVILGFALLIASLGAQASMECSIKTIKKGLFGALNEKTVSTLNVQNGSLQTIDSLRVGSIKLSSGIGYRYLSAYWLDAYAECSAEGQCSFVGRIHDTYLQVHADGREEYLGSTLRSNQFQISKNEYQDFHYQKEGKDLTIRIECK